ncbi:FtsW/RodA/SpoVE family cell cycle protein [Acinetobacter baumannii]
MGILLHDYQRQRVLTLLDPEADVLGTGRNIIQSKNSNRFWWVLTGKGFLEGTQSHYFTLLTRRPY